MSADPLSTYPRPAEDNGWGFHSSSGAYEQPWMSEAWRVRFAGKRDISALTAEDKRKVMRDYAQMLHDEYGVRWFKLLAAGAEQLDFLEALVSAGIETIVRTWTGEPHPQYVVPVDEVKRYLDLGAHYIEWGNEPNLFGEWDRRFWVWDRLVPQLVDQMLRNFDAIRRASVETGVQAVPLVPSLSPGGHYDARTMFRQILEELQRRNELGALQGAAVAIHNRPHNIPVDVPPSDTLTITFREYEWYDDQVRTFLGHSLPLLGTEAGYEIGDHTVAEFPPIDGELHAEYNMQILRGFKDKWRPALFCVCMWLIEIYEPSNYAFANAAWWYNKIAGGMYPESILPAVHALRNEPKFVRRMPWETGTPPVEEEEEAPTLTVVRPPEGWETERPTLDAEGTARPPGATVVVRRSESSEVLGQVTSADDGRWRLAGIPLQEGQQRLHFQVLVSGQAGPEVQRTVVRRPPDTVEARLTRLEAKVAELDERVRRLEA